MCLFILISANNFTHDDSYYITVYWLFQVYRGHVAMVRSISVSPCGQWLASGTITTDSAASGDDISQCKLYAPRVREVARKNAFPIRIIQMWNRHP